MTHLEESEKQPQIWNQNVCCYRKENNKITWWYPRRTFSQSDSSSEHWDHGRSSNQLHIRRLYQFSKQREAWAVRDDESCSKPPFRSKFSRIPRHCSSYSYSSFRLKISKSLSPQAIRTFLSGQETPRLWHHGRELKSPSDCSSLEKRYLGLLDRCSSGGSGGCGERHAWRRSMNDQMLRIFRGF